MLYWSGELSQEDAAATECHLRICPVCQDMVAVLTGLADDFSSLPVLEPERELLGPALNNGARTAWPQKKSGQDARRVPHKRRWWEWIFPNPALQFATALIVALVLGAWVGLTNMSPPSTGTHWRASKPLASSFEGSLKPHIVKLDKQIEAVKMRISGRRQQTRRVFGKSNSAEMLSTFRSEMQRVKKRLTGIRSPLFRRRHRTTRI